MKANSSQCAAKEVKTLNREENVSILQGSGIKDQKILWDVEDRSLIRFGFRKKGRGDLEREPVHHSGKLYCDEELRNREAAV